MSTPNTKCSICGKEFYAGPSCKDKTLCHGCKIRKWHSSLTIEEKLARKEKFRKTVASDPDFYKKREEKIKQTNLEKYGEEHFTNVEKRKQTNLEKYGHSCSLHGEEARKKTLATWEKNFNGINPSQRKEQREAISKANRENALTRIEKLHQTCLKKYGASTYLNSEEGMKRRRSRYFYDGEQFDSSYELIFYLYHRELKHNIIRLPKKLQFIFENKYHDYYPDFEIDGVLYEVKGPHFFKNGVLINPYDRSQDNFSAAKYECMTNNNIKIVKDISKEKRYLENIYGKKFYTKYRVK